MTLFLCLLVWLATRPKVVKRAVRTLNLRMLSVAELRGMGKEPAATWAERYAYERYLEEIGLGAERLPGRQGVGR